MRKWILGFAFILFGVLIWFLFIRSYDFTVSFKAKTLPEIVNQSVKVWNKKIKGNLDRQPNEDIIQKVQLEGRSLSYLWNIEQRSDSTSQVTVFIVNENLSILNKLRIPFSDTPYEEAVKKNLTEYLELLNDQLKNIKVEVIGVSSIEATYCAYIPIKGKQFAKARGMMENYGLLSTIFVDTDVKLNGHPFIEITKWDRETDSIFYNFCYPIIKKDSLPQNEKIKYKQFNTRKAIKAIYNGNYMTSDRAWYTIKNYAKNNEIEVIDTPIEVFLSNPNMGGNELDWITHVYLPIKQ
jgi:effector-binding domain-containing protein